MFKIEQLDAKISHEQQIAGEKEGPVTLINIFHVPEGDVDVFVETWGDVIREFKSTPGFISAEFYRGTTGSDLHEPGGLGECRGLSRCI